MICFKNNYEETEQRFGAFFHGEKTERPLLNIWTPRMNEFKIDAPPMDVKPFDSVEDNYTNTDKNYAACFNYNLKYRPRAEAFPNFSMNLGAGSLALYLGSEPIFKRDTVWFEKVNESYDRLLPLKYDENNKWWITHLNIVKRQKELAQDTDIMICMPDLIENLDILASLRGSEQLCYDIYDYPNEIRKALDNIAELYPIYYNIIYDIIINKNGATAFTAFNIMGKGKTVKLQCDFSALINNEQFNELVIPSLQKQCYDADNVLFHLDGPECIQHTESLMKLDGLGALQWTPGVKNPPAGDECWDSLYRTVFDSGRGLWLALYDYGRDEAIARADRLVKKFGSKGFYFLFGGMSDQEADELLLKAEHDWKN